MKKTVLEKLGIKKHTANLPAPKKWMSSSTKKNPYVAGAYVGNPKDPEPEET